MGSLYRFGPFSLDSARRTLFRSGSPVSLTARSFDVLLFLAQNPNRLVTREELLQTVWGDRFVEEGNLARYISHVRKTLGDNSEDTRWIVTIPRKGYQFTADVSIVEPEDAPTQTRRTDSPPSDVRPFEGIQRETRAAIGLASWRTAAVVSAAVALTAAVGVASWRHFTRTTSQSSQRILLAVLPFKNLTGDPNKEYLADGLTEETISQLGRLDPERLGVIARTSVMGYKQKDWRLDQIGRDLSVQYILENSLRQNGDHLRLTAQLVQVKNQNLLWSHEYDYSIKDPFVVEDDVARSVAQEIRLRLTSQQQAQSAGQRPEVPEAFDAYMQGYYFFERDIDEDSNTAAKCYERAVQLDSSYALAWVGLSRARHWQAVRGLIPRDEGRRLARDAVERALTLNPNLATAHAQMSRIERQDDFDWAGADVSIQRAVALDPGDPENLSLAAFSAAILGRFDEGLRFERRAVDLDPLNAMSWETLAEIDGFMGRLEEAAANRKKAFELRPDLWNGHYFLGETYVMQGRLQEALPEIERVAPRDFRLYLYALAYYALGQAKEADAALAELLMTYQEVDEYLIAKVYAFRNQPDEAFRWLERGYARHNDGLILVKVDPLLKNLHHDPRYDAFLKKLKLAN